MSAAAPARRPATLLTGASGAIVGALAQRLARDGHDLLLTGLEPEKLEHVRASAASVSAGGRVEAVAGDLRDPGFAPCVVDETVSRLGRLDNLVTGAGASRPAKLGEIEDGEWEQLLDLNLSAVFRLSKAAAARMIAQGAGGAMVHVSSIAHANGGANLAYGAAKGGVVTLTRGLADQLGPHGVRVNAVAPGVINTPMVRNALGPAFGTMETAASARTPLRRLGRAEDVAGVIAFLLSDDAAFVTGAVVPITGGMEILPALSSFAGFSRADAASHTGARA